MALNMTDNNFTPFIIASPYGPGPQRLPTALRPTLPALLPVSSPPPNLFSLQKLGISTAEAFQVLTQLKRSNDTLYHAGKLLNGKTYLISANDQVFYGKAGQMQPMPVVHAYRTKCIGQQKRVLETANGLTITIQAQNGQPTTAQVSQRFWNTKLAFTVPHLRQMDLSAIRIEI